MKHALLAFLMVLPLLGASPRWPVRDPIWVRGPVELTRVEAFRAADRLALDHWKCTQMSSARRWVADAAPAWLPSALAERAIRRWVVSEQSTDVVRDRRVIEHEHGFGPSYHVEILLDAEALGHLDRHATRSLERELRRTERRTAFLGGIVFVVWLLAAVASSWLDRLSRGYMRHRLRVLFGGAAVAVTALAFITI